MVSTVHLQKLREAGERTVKRLKEGGVIPEVNGKASSSTRRPLPHPTDLSFDGLPHPFGEAFQSILERENEVLRDDLDWL
jgi:hypothetical protein